METNSTGATPSAGWVKLAKFRLYKNLSGPSPETAWLFDNGLQQCTLWVEVIGADIGGNPHYFTPDDIRTRLTLIHHAGGQPLSPDNYVFSFEKNEYEWDEYVIPGASPPAKGRDAGGAGVNHPTASGDPIPVYVRTNSPPSVALRIAARFLLPDGTSYAATNFNVDDPEGEGVGGQFNSSVNLKPVRFPSLPVTSYGDVASDGTLNPTPVGSQNYFYGAVEHSLHVNLNGTELRLKSVDGGYSDREFAIYKRGAFFDDVQWAISYYRQPDSTTVAGLPVYPLDHINVDGRSDAANCNEDPGNGHAVRVTSTATGNVSEISTTVRYGRGNDSLSTRDSDRTAYKPRAMYDNLGISAGADPYRVSVGMLQGRSFPATFQDAAGATVADVTQGTLRIHDAHGNTHALSLSFGSQANQVKLRKA